MALKKIEETVLTFEVNEDLVMELRAAPMTCTSRPVPSPANDANVFKMLERMQRESLYVA